MEKTYPDISSLLKAKALRRRELAALSWEEKVAIIKRMNQLLPEEKWNIGHKETSQTSNDINDNITT